MTSITTEITGSTTMAGWKEVLPATKPKSKQVKVKYTADISQDLQAKGSISVISGTSMNAYKQTHIKYSRQHGNLTIWNNISNFSKNMSFTQFLQTFKIFTTYYRVYKKVDTFKIITELKKIFLSIQQLFIMWKLFRNYSLKWDKSCEPKGIS